MTAMMGPLFMEAMMSTGRLFMTPPSASTPSGVETGGSTPGSETLALSASRTRSRRWVITSPVVRLVETQKKGRHRSGMRVSPKFSSSSRSTRLPRTSPMIGSE
jgi:hypothetical protein